MNFNKKEIDVIARASAIIEERAQYKAIAFAGPNAVADCLCLRVGRLEHEVFGVLWLDAQYRLIEADELFRGTMIQISVYPREAVNTALARVAGAAVLYHNHPSGVAEPSRAGQLLTGTLTGADA